VHHLTSGIRIASYWLVRRKHSSAFAAMRALSQSQARVQFVLRRRGSAERSHTVIVDQEALQAAAGRDSKEIA
jgi:hypothetical protein